MLKILTIGKSGRLDCIVDAISRSSKPNKVYVLSEVENPGLIAKAEHIHRGLTEDCRIVGEYAKKVKPDFAIIGPEEPLAAGVVDLLESLGVPTIGPKKKLAKLEWSKSFTRGLLAKYNIPGNPEYKAFTSIDGIESYMHALSSFVVKPDGLTGGKGVRVLGVHMHSVSEAVDYCRELFDSGQPAVLIEERLDGEEFSLQSFCDGSNVVDMVPVQDHKRIGEGDTGPNTGGMGSYSCEDHSLPFLPASHLQAASSITARLAHALREEVGAEYKGVLFGGFIATQDGVRVLEYNARFGDPEIMNVLPLLKVDFIDVCQAIIDGHLDRLQFSSEMKATVCKYVVPQGYPSAPRKGALLDIDSVPLPNNQLRVFYGAVDRNSDGGFYLTGSRAIAFVGIGDNLFEAEKIAEEAACQIRGAVYHRRDIGTSFLVGQRVSHMNSIMGADSNPRNLLKRAS